jgi:hypothetical protein
MRPGLLLRLLLRPLFWAARLAELIDRVFLTGGTRTLSRVPRALGSVLSRIQSGSLTEYLLLIFTGLALLVVARLFS